MRVEWVRDRSSENVLSWLTDVQSVANVLLSTEVIWDIFNTSNLQYKSQKMC